MRTGKMLIKNFVVAQLPFPFFFLASSLLLFILPLFPHLLPATAKKSGAVASLGLVSHGAATNGCHRVTLFFHEKKPDDFFSHMGIF